MQGQPDEIFGGRNFPAALLNVAHSLVRLDLFVTERNQGKHCLVGLLLFRGWRLDATRYFPGRRHAELVF